MFFGTLPIPIPIFCLSFFNSSFPCCRFPSLLFFLSHYIAVCFDLLIECVCVCVYVRACVCVCVFFCCWFLSHSPMCIDETHINENQYNQKNNNNNNGKQKRTTEGKKQTPKRTKSSSSQLKFSVNLCIVERVCAPEIRKIKSEREKLHIILNAKDCVCVRAAAARPMSFFRNNFSFYKQPRNHIWILCKYRVCVK